MLSAYVFMGSMADSLACCFENVLTAQLQTVRDQSPSRDVSKAHSATSSQRNGTSMGPGREQHDISELLVLR